MSKDSKVSKDIQKSLENPIVEVVKTDDIKEVMNTSRSKKQKSAPNQIPLTLDKFENSLIKKRFPE